MSTPAQDTSPLAFGELLADLRRRGFRIGVGHHLRLQQLLNKAGAETAPEDLKTLLCPLFATNQTEQEHFYRAFDNFFQLYRAAPPRQPSEGAGETLAAQPPPAPARAARRKLFYLLGAALAATVITVFFVNRTSPPAGNEQSIPAVAVDETPTTPLPAPAPRGTIDPAQPAETPSTLATQPVSVESASPSPTPEPDLPPGLLDRLISFITGPLGRLIDSVVSSFSAFGARLNSHTLLSTLFGFTMTLAPLVIFLLYDHSSYSVGATARSHGRVGVAALLLTVFSQALFWMVTFSDLPSIGAVLAGLAYLSVLLYSLYLFADVSAENVEEGSLPHVAVISFALMFAGAAFGVTLAAVAFLLFELKSLTTFIIEQPYAQVFHLVAVLPFVLFLLVGRQPLRSPGNRPAIYELLRPGILGLAVVAAAPAFLYFVTVHWTYLLTAPLFFLIYEWHSRRRRRLVLQKQHGKKPPYVWPVRVEAFAPKLYEQDVFYDAARAMRRRQTGEHARLDVEATVSATVASLGYPSFRYRVSSRPPEYLVLIDRAGFRDHQAQLFNELAKGLEREGVFVARYFFDGDPRVCCEESGAGCLTLAELRSRFAGHRLLVFGDGVMLLDPVTGEVASWAALFAEWRDRALLTPRAAAEWGLREISLASLFSVLPATLEGLLALVAHFESLTAGDVRSWRRSSTEPAPPEFYGATATPALVTELRAYLGERVFQWLAACAVYPELHWDLTLYLGSLQAMGGDLIREENLLRLIRLPWFRRGSIPDDARWLLIRELDQDKERAVRAAIVELLEKNPPPAETYAADSYQLNLVVQRWLSRRGRRRREALEALRAAPRSRIARDYTLMRYLESADGSALSLLLPTRLRTLFYRDGIPAFGLKTASRLALMLAVTALALAARQYAPALNIMAPQSPDPRLGAAAGQTSAGQARGPAEAETSTPYEEVAREWRDQLYPVAQRLETGYPFTGSGSSSVTDLARYLNPVDGQLTVFFNSRLAPSFKDVQGQWEQNQLGAFNFAFSGEFVAYLNNARRLRDALFPGGGKQPEVNYDVTLLPLKGSDVLLEIDGTRVESRGTAPAAAKFVFPARADQPSGARVVVFSGGEIQEHTFPGEWGLFKLLQEGGATAPSADNSYQITLGIGTVTVRALLRPSNVVNPFDRALFTSLRAPRDVR